jgi:hypothetical protein
LILHGRNLGAQGYAMNIQHMSKLLVAAGAYFLSAAAACATPITVSYLIAQTGTAAITEDVFSPFTLSLDAPVDFFHETEATAGSNTITAIFTFSELGSGTVGSGSISATDTFKLTGNVNAQHDTLKWDNGGLVAVTFLDGSVLDITLTTDSFNGNGARKNYEGLTSTIAFNLVNGPTAVASDPVAISEPGTLRLLGVGILGILGVVYVRRRKARDVFERTELPRRPEPVALVDAQRRMERTERTVINLFRRLGVTQSATPMS